MNYATRHLEATADFPHGNLYLKKGDRFFATEVDADYYKGKGKATDVVEAPPPAATVKSPAAGQNNLRKAGQAAAPARPAGGQTKPLAPDPAPAAAPPVSAPAAGVTTFADLNPAAAAESSGTPAVGESKP